MWRSRPLIGVGPGNFEVRIGAMIPGVRTHANDYYLHVLAEQGAIGVCALLALVGGTIATLARALERPIVLGVCAAMIGLWTHQLVDGLLIYPKVGVFAWVLTGVGVAASHRRVTPVSSSTCSIAF